MNKREELANWLNTMANADGSNQLYSNTRCEYFRRAAELLTQPCPHIVSSDEGTSYCALAEASAREAALLRRVVQEMRIILAHGDWDDFVAHMTWVEAEYTEVTGIERTKS